MRSLYQHFEGWAIDAIPHGIGIPNAVLDLEPPACTMGL
jgi:hypothetical protein